MENIPFWLYNTETFRYSDLSELSYSLPDTSEITNINEFVTIVSLCKEWKYNNEGKKYPMDVYLFCLTNFNEVLEFIQNKDYYSEIESMMKGEDDSLENYFGSIALYLKQKQQIENNSLLYLQIIAPLEFAFTTDKVYRFENEILYANFIYSLKGESKILRFEAPNGDFEWSEFRDKLKYLSENFITLVKDVKRLERYKSQLQCQILKEEELISHKEYIEIIEEIKNINSFFELSIRGDILNFKVDLDDLFSYKIYSKITSNVYIPNIIVYIFIYELNKFVQETDVLYS